MVRTLSVAAAALAFAFSFAPASAHACDGNPECPMKKSAKQDDQKTDLKAEKKADKTTATKVEVKATDKKAVTPPTDSAVPAVKPTEQTSIMQEIDTILAAKCSCSSASDCTCKKGECKCSKCGGAKKATNIRMIESLRGQDDGTILPANNARYDATAGVFI